MGFMGHDLIAESAHARQFFKLRERERERERLAKMRNRETEGQCYH